MSTATSSQTSASQPETTMTDFAPATVHAPGRIARIWNVARLHLVDLRTYVGIPWIIVGTAFVITLIISVIITYSTGSDPNSPTALVGQRYSWAVLAPQWYLIVVAVQAIGMTFPFALGFSVTRRDFYLGTSLLFVMISAFNAVAFMLLTQIEKLTNGWGIGAHMFNALWFGVDGWWVDLLTFFSMQMFIFFLGASVATIYMRWRMPGMLVFWVSLAVLILGAAALITFTSSWTAVIAWFTAQGIAGFFSWLFIPTLFAATCGYLTLRKATPKN
ncbi:hypothetical protein [Leifsonia sp. A12D58]|uniref:hypothetical protein n=1 Tax=Leifsonia sp. A12D58 TaxID=3397674 RepID=UPI0039DFCB08